eukprot:CAMPEP_0183304290 /NCGR_PEP_ID=MMETSP0160_2-20130417/9428_1 /TAXON_ID=2839 ORGANISM="Odontella Sinensis, Strain Grunow 1884" /NCGR_SAMPLE_ID=MMETSP0160_2 /ASSEMBLY_ACC=CAM_ASM_000250 /LENGTH=271 /DNA_ID=CAMNT_0025467311 /DNA_START=27 /DNA_END=842 /DNA_ORIENTATION=+
MTTKKATADVAKEGSAAAANASAASAVSAAKEAGAATRDGVDHRIGVDASEASATAAVVSDDDDSDGVDDRIAETGETGAINVNKGDVWKGGGESKKDATTAEAEAKTSKAVGVVRQRRKNPIERPPVAMMMSGSDGGRGGGDVGFMLCGAIDPAAETKGAPPATTGPGGRRPNGASRNGKRVTVDDYKNSLFTKGEGSDGAVANAGGGSGGPQTPASAPKSFPPPPVNPLHGTPRCDCGCVPNVPSLFEMAEMRKQARLRALKVKEEGRA